MDMTDLWRALRRFWQICLATFLATTALGYLLATSGDATFGATSTVVVSPNPAEGGSVPFVEFEAPKIVEVLTSRDFIAGLDEMLSAESAAAMVEFDVEKESASGIVRITASGADREAVADWSNAAAAAIVDRYMPTDRDPETPPSIVDLVEVELVESAIAPAGSGLPSILPVMMASAVLGMILAGTVPALLYKSSVAFDVAEQIRNEVGTPVLGEIPMSREFRAADADMRTLVELHPPTLVEAFQRIRINAQVHVDNGTRVLAVTSWGRYEGKSTMTAALGIMLASVGHMVVLIDTDLRAPTLHDRLGEPFGEGLAEYNKLGLNMVLHKTRFPRLRFIPAGIPNRHPAQIVAVALHQAIKEIRAEHPDTVILLDSPALGPVRDSRASGVSHRPHPRVVAESATVMRDAENVLLVVSATTSKIPDLATGVRRLDEAGVGVIGAVINRQRRQRWWRL